MGPGGRCASDHGWRNRPSCRSMTWRGGWNFTALSPKRSSSHILLKRLAPKFARVAWCISAKTREVVSGRDRCRAGPCLASGGAMARRCGVRCIAHRGSDARRQSAGCKTHLRNRCPKRSAFIPDTPSPAYESIWQSIKDEAVFPTMSIRWIRFEGLPPRVAAA